MKHVIELEDGDAAVLRETGSGGLIGRGLLHDDPLGEYLGTDEQPKYVVRNKRGGFSVERTGTDGTSTEAVADPDPDGDHSAAALVTDTRVLFAVGRSEGDRTRSVPLADVVDVHVTDGFLGGEIVFETVEDERYRFPSRGELAPVREFVDAAAGIWARAERQLESAEDRLDRTERAFESGDVDVVLAAVGEIRETLESARETASSLDGASASVEERVAAARERLAAAERRAYAEQADNARERGHTRWEDHEFERAFDHFERADESYAAALAIDADEPDDALIKRRRASLASESDRLASVPKELAEQAVEAATAAEDLASEIEWYERALDRYERLHSLDWGRDERRFDGDRDAIREELATVAAALVDARCERARRALALLDDAPPAAASTARERAADALEAAHELARERVPDAVDTVERLQRDLAAERERGPDDEAGVPTATPADDTDDPATTPTDDTVVVSADDEVDGTETDDEVDGTETDEVDGTETDEVDGTETDDEVDGTVTDEVDGTETDDDASGAPERVDDDATVPDTEREEWVFVDDQSDDKWVSAERTETVVDDAESSDPAPGSTAPDTGTPDSESEPASDESPSDLVDAVSEAAQADSELIETVSETVETELEATDAADSAGDDTASSTETGAPSAGDLGTVGSAAFRTLVADLFEAKGWTTEEPSEPLSEQDFQATTPEPVSITVSVMTVAADAAAAVDTDDVERFAAVVEQGSAVDHAVLVAAARLPEATRQRAIEMEIRLVDPDRLTTAVQRAGVSVPDDPSTES